jgi:hypothetical protein
VDVATFGDAPAADGPVAADVVHGWVLAGAPPLALAQNLLKSWTTMMDRASMSRLSDYKKY